MSIYLLQLISNWISLLVLFLASISGTVNLNSKVIEIDNDNKDKNLNVVNTVVKYTTKIKYNSSLPSNVKNILVEGVDGIVYKNDNGEIGKIIKNMVPEEIEIGTGPYGEYIGRMTGYGPDCYGCTGVVKCKTEGKQNYNIFNEGIYYTDDEYGKVRVLAADNRKFPCGTIVEVDNGLLEPFIGVVLDTGQAMRDAWEEQVVWMDLAFSTENNPEVRKATSYNVKYSVKRWGW